MSLHVSHPTRSANQVISSIGLETRYARSAGEPRVTPSGNPLGGAYARTDVSFRVSDGVVHNHDILVADYVDRTLDRVPLEAISEMVRSGGSCFLLLGIYAEASLLCDFSPMLLSRLAPNGIGLKLDFYGGPENRKIVLESCSQHFSSVFVSCSLSRTP